MQGCACDECRYARVPFEPNEQEDITHWDEFRVVDHEYKNKTIGKIKKTKKTDKAFSLDYMQQSYIGVMKSILVSWRRGKMETGVSHTCCRNQQKTYQITQHIRPRSFD